MWKATILYSSLPTRLNALVIYVRTCFTKDVVIHRNNNDPMRGGGGSMKNYRKVDGGINIMCSNS